MKTRLLLLSIFMLSCLHSNSQSNKDVAKNKTAKAIELMDNGNIDESIKLLEEAKKLDPNSYIYDYEKAYAYYLKQDYKTSLKLYKDVVKYDDITDQCFQMLGNLYDVNGEPEKALSAYDKGLKKFPKSGRLYLEKGNVYWGQKKYATALPLYESGITVEPMFPSNYYRATLLFLNSTEQVWGMIYGEIFINLEQNSKRAAEISKLLYDVYKAQIKFKLGDTVSVSFSKNNTININDLKDIQNFKLPFGVGAYEPVLLMSIVNEKEINLNSLDRIRKNFVENYFKNEYITKYPNVLFDYHNYILKAGHMEAYNHWLLLKGDETGFNQWLEANKFKFDNFLEWLKDNKINITEKNVFCR